MKTCWLPLLVFLAAPLTAQGRGDPPGSGFSVTWRSSPGADERIPLRGDSVSGTAVVEVDFPPGLQRVEVGVDGTAVSTDLSHPWTAYLPLATGERTVRFVGYPLAGDTLRAEATFFRLAEARPALPPDDPPARAAWGPCPGGIATLVLMSGTRVCRADIP